MTDRAALHAEAAKLRAGEFGSERAQVPLGERKRDGHDPATWVKTEFRAQPVQREGRDFYQLEGYASMVGRSYEMYDMFGPYEEVVDPHAFDETLAAEPMVVYRFNHGGMSMASTGNGRLELWADALGLGNRAFLNPERDDVRQLVKAIEDGDVTEQSFMFRIDDGIWNDDMDKFTINKVDLDRGDVGPVTYGANPHTLVAARSGEFLAAIPDLPPLVAREAYVMLSARRDLESTPVRVLIPPVPVEAERPETREPGKSLRLALAQLELDKQTR
jgi:HK97 family phage prohead protease